MNEIHQETNQEDETQCGFCEEELGQLPQTTLECQHICHTRCLLINVAACHQADLRSKCTLCQSVIISRDTQLAIFQKAEELMTVIRTDPDDATVRILNESSEDFKQDVKVLNEKKKTVIKLVKEFRKKRNQIHTEYKETTKELLMILRGTHKQTLKNVFKTEEYALAKKAIRAYGTQFSKMSTKYNISSNILDRFLNTRPNRNGNRRIRYFRYHRHMQWELIYPTKRKFGFRII